MLVRDPQLIVDLFLNYDCDLEGKGIFSSMCDDLSRLSCTVHVETTEQDALLKTLALEMLVDITDSMVQWERDNKDGAADGAEPSGGGAAEASASASAAADGDGADGGGSTAVVAKSGDGDTDVDFMKNFHRKHEVAEGVVKFNMKPKKGIHYLRDVCGLEMTSDSVARFLLTTEGLDKRAVGDYLGEGDDFNKSVLYAYVDSIDFSGLTFDASLRKFLSHFWLPGEAQKIDRMMEKFRLPLLHAERGRLRQRRHGVRAGVLADHAQHRRALARRSRRR